ncbi:MAG: hypothetical protein IH624_13245 [Phycisphaerae bacterium]|nr:hypothetical protein [Phycisphaerae bacterium]
MSRIWPIICQFGIGGVLCAIGIICGLRGRYFDMKLPRDRRFLAVVILGFIVLLALAAIFTFLAPYWPQGATP